MSENKCRNYLCIKHTFFYILTQNFKCAYYTQEININFLSSYLFHHIPDDITEYKLYL